MQKRQVRLMTFTGSTRSHMFFTIYISMVDIYVHFRFGYGHRKKINETLWFKTNKTIFPFCFFVRECVLCLCECDQFFFFQQKVMCRRIFIASIVMRMRNLEYN